MVRPLRSAGSSSHGGRARLWWPALLVTFVPACLLGFDADELSEGGTDAPAGDAGRGGTSAAGGGGQAGGGASSGGAGAAAGAGAAGGGGAGAGGAAGGSCQPARPAACEPQTLADAENCCAAGRSCLGGACEQGECGAVTLGASANAEGEEVLDVVVVGGKVFWSSGFGSRLYAVPAGGGPVTVHATSNDAPARFVTRLAADATHVYYTNFGSGRVARVPVGGGALEIVAEVPAGAAEPAAGFGQIAAGGGYVFWALETSGGVFAAPVGGALPATPLVLDETDGFGVATDGVHVYWGTAAGSIVRRPVADLSAPTEVVVSDQGAVRDVEVFGDRVYWSDFGSVHSALKAGLNQLIVVVFGNGPGSPRGIASDGHDVFVTTAGSTEPPRPAGLFRAPLLGGAAVELATAVGPGDLRAVVADCDALYVANAADRNVLKLAR